jgi:hypothetical protein
MRAIRELDLFAFGGYLFAVPFQARLRFGPDLGGNPTQMTR